MSDSKLSVEYMRKIYHIRCREINVKANFPSAFTDPTCPYTRCTSEDTQSHLFHSSCFTTANQVTNNNTEYTDIFSDNIEAQVGVMQVMFSKLEQRRESSSFSGERFPADPRKKAVAPRLGIQKAKQQLNKTNKIKHKNNTRG